MRMPVLLRTLLLAALAVSLAGCDVLQSAYEQLAGAPAGTTVAQIAYACGFKDQSQFSHAFKRRYACSPSELLHGKPV